MRDARVWGLIAVIVAVMAFPAIALAQPVPPQVFVGSVTQGDVPVPEGTEVTAWIDGAQVGAGTVTNGQYKVLVVQPQGQSFVDKPVTFQVGGIDVPETSIWQVGGASEVSLSAPSIEQTTVNTEAPAQPEVISEPTPGPTPDTETRRSETIVVDDGERKNRRAFVGVVDGDPGATVDVLRNGTNERVTIRLEDYKLKKPGKTVAGSFADGARVVILSQRDGEEWVAIWVMVKPLKLVNRPVIGTVVGVENGVLSIIQPDGTTDTVELPAGAQAPDTGEVITLFANTGDADSTGRGKKARAKAKGLVKASKIRGRLEGFLQELTTDEASVPEKAPGGNLTSARQRVEWARERALAARAEADAAHAKAEATQTGDTADVNELAAEAEEKAVQAELDLAEAEAEAAELEAEAVEEAVEAEKKSAERRADRVDDVASILDALTSQHTAILQSLAEGSILPEEALQGITNALENAQRGRSQATLKATQARAKSLDKKRNALAKAEQKREKAQAKATEKREKAQAKAAEKAAKDQAKAAAKAESAGKPDDSTTSSGKRGKPESAGKPDDSTTSSGTVGKPESAGNSGQGKSKGKKK